MSHAEWAGGSQCCQQSQIFLIARRPSTAAHNQIAISYVVGVELLKGLRAVALERVAVGNAHQQRKLPAEVAAEGFN